jgi:hypothetical protein
MDVNDRTVFIKTDDWMWQRRMMELIVDHLIISLKRGQHWLQVR